MGVFIFRKKGNVMATEPVMMILNETDIQAALSQPKAISPEFLCSFYTAHYQYVLQVCRRFFRQSEDAEDAAAEVFLKLYRVLHQKDASLPFRPWLSQVAGHHCIDKLRQKKRERSFSMEDMDYSAFVDRSTPSPLSQLLTKDDQRRIREHLTRLPEKYKTPLVMRYYERLSYSEIAERLNKRLPTVRIMIFRAKAYLRKSLRRSDRMLADRRISKLTARPAH
jgi:RNA polymerase sigma-70 factor, ECF subfamily